jgi:hypothetical protein
VERVSAADQRHLSTVIGTLAMMIASQDQGTIIAAA